MVLKNEITVLYGSDEDSQEHYNNLMTKFKNYKSPRPKFSKIEQKIIDIVTNAKTDSYTRVPIHVIIRKGIEQNLSEMQIIETVWRLCRSGAIFEPREGYFSN